MYLFLLILNLDVEINNLGKVEINNDFFRKIFNKLIKFF